MLKSTEICAYVCVKNRKICGIIYNLLFELILTNGENLYYTNLFNQIIKLKKNIK